MAGGALRRQSQSRLAVATTGTAPDAQTPAHPLAGAEGCNIGVWRSDFLAVDGFDEAFSGWGHEDSDFAIRLIRAGLKLKDGRFAVPVLHLWHKENDRSQQPENQRRLQATLNGNHTRAERGLSQYASANTRNQATDIQARGAAPDSAPAACMQPTALSRCTSSRLRA